MSIRTMTRVWDQSTQSGTHLLMLLAIADFSDDDGRAYPSVLTLASKCRMKERNAQTILKALKASGELEVRENEGPKGTNLYRVNFTMLGVQGSAGVQRLAGVQGSAPGGAKACAKPLQRIAPEPSLNHQEPSLVARKHAARFDASLIDLPEWLDRSAWIDWVEDRKERRKPITERAANQQIKTLDRMRSEGHAPADVIANSIANGYQGLFPPKVQGMATGSTDEGMRPAWAVRAGFATRFEAENAGCTERNAAQFRDGRRVTNPREVA